MSIQINGLVRAPLQPIDGYVGEPLHVFPPFLSVTLPDGTSLTEAGTQFIPTRSGWHSFETPVGEARVLVFNPDAVIAVPERTTGRSAPRSIAERRIVLRALAAHGGLKGGELRDVCAVGNLAAYGA